MTTSTPISLKTGNLITESIKDTIDVAKTPIASGDLISRQPSNLTGPKHLKTEMLDILNSSNVSASNGPFNDKSDSTIALESSNNLSMEAKFNVNLGK